MNDWDFWGSGILPAVGYLWLGVYLIISLALFIGALSGVNDNFCKHQRIKILFPVTAVACWASQEDIKK